MKLTEYNGQPALVDSEGNLYRILSRRLNNFSDAIVQVSKGVGGPGRQIHTERDWKVVEDLIKIYAHFFTSQYNRFLKEVREVASNQTNKFGLLSDKTTRKGGDIQIRSLGYWPFELEIMIRIVWPNQKFDRAFNQGFFNRFKNFRTAERI